MSQGTFVQDGVTKDYANLDLAVNQANSTSYTYTDPEGNVIGDYDLNLEALTLPLSRGYGDVKALPIAASLDSTLLQSLKDLSNLSPSDYSSINQRIEDIIYQWSGTANITGNRGVFDARKLAAMENFRGVDYTTFSHNLR